MASELNNVEKLLVSEHGFKDNGDGTVAAPSGALYDGEQGGYYTETGAAPVSNVATGSAIENLADLTFLAQNTGVSSAVLNNAYEAVGLDSSDPFAYGEAHQILRDNGYNPGDNAGFYGSNQALDAGAKLLNERWQEAPTEEDLAAAGLENMTIINSNGANSEWLTNALAANNIDTNQTNARTGLVASYSNIDDRASDNPFWGPKIKEFGSYDNATLDMLEWEELQKKLVSDTYQKESTNALPANTGTFDYAAGENVPVQAVPQTVTQQVTPPTYYNPPVEGVNKSITDEQAGTFSKQLQTAGLSAVPATATYKTHYAGTQGLVDPTLYAPVGGGTGPQQVIYENNLGQRMTVTETNGAPTTYVPPGFVRKGTMQEIMQQQSTNMAQGGAVRGYADGGDVALIKLAKMNGFKGDDIATARSFMNASEGLRNKVKAMGALMNRGGLAMAQGGSVPNQAMIGGQPHRLAYVNPQE